MGNEFQQKLTGLKIAKLQWHLQEKCNYLSKKTFCAVATSVDHALHWLCSTVCMCFTMCRQCPADSKGPAAGVSRTSAPPMHYGLRRPVG